MVCGDTFESEGRRALYCSNDCRNEARRTNYARNPHLQRMRALEFRNSPRGKILRARAFEDRRAQGRLKWYEGAIVDTPRGLQPLRRLYWEACRKMSSGKVSRRHVRIYDRVKKTVAVYRQLDAFSKKDLAAAKKFVITVRKELDGG